MRSREPRSYVTHEADVIGDRAHFAQLDNAVPKVIAVPQFRNLACGTISGTSYCAIDAGGPAWST